MTLSTSPMLDSETLVATIQIENNKVDEASILDKSLPF